MTDHNLKPLWPNNKALLLVRGIWYIMCEIYHMFDRLCHVSQRKMDFKKISNISILEWFKAVLFESLLSACFQLSCVMEYERQLNQLQFDFVGVSLLASLTATISRESGKLSFEQRAAHAKTYLSKRAI